MLSREVRVDRETITKQILENVDSIAWGFKIQELLKKYEEYEKEEEKIFEKLPEALRNALKIIDKYQDELIADILHAALKIIEYNQRSNALWKKYDMKGSYVRMKRLYRLPLFEVTLRRWKRGRVRKIPGYSRG